MGRKKEVQKDIDQIQTSIAKNKVVLGTKRTIMYLRTGKLAKVFVTANCPAAVQEDIKTYASLSDCDMQELKYTNEELGVVCKKPFSISVVGLLK